MLYLPIALLSVNREARTEKLKIYKKVESYLFQVPCYFNPDRDLVDFTELWRYEEGWRRKLKVVNAFERNGVEARYIVHVGLGECVWTGEELREKYISSVLRRH